MAALPAKQALRAWLSGRRADSVLAVSDEMARVTSFVGTDDDVRARIRAFRS